MRLICEAIDAEFFIEVILNPNDIERLQERGQLLGEYIGSLQGIRNFNLFIRKEGVCHWSKEKQQEVEKDFQKTCDEKCTKVNPKNKLSLLRIQKRVEAKRSLRKK